MDDDAGRDEERRADPARWGAPAAAKSLRLTIGFALGVMVFWLAVTMGVGVVVAAGEQDLGAILTSGLAWNIAIAAMIAIFAAAFLGKLRPWFARPLPGSWRAIWIPALYLLVLAALASQTELPTAGRILMVLANTLLVGLSEEVMFRGIVYHALRSRLGIWSAAILSSALFGAVHVANVLVTENLSEAVTQAILASLTGLVLVAMMLRTGSLIWPILYHALWDLFTILIMPEAAARENALPEIDILATVLLLGAFALPNLLNALWLIYRLPRHPEALARA